MAEEAIDFGGFARKILVNPIVPLQILNVFYRSGNRVQATLLGKVYSNSIQILEVIPTSLAQNDQIITVDFAEHQKSLDNILSVYSSLQIIGVVITNLKPGPSLAKLHTMYSHKDTGFKQQGILLFPIILSINTALNMDSKDIEMHAYSFNRTFRNLKDVTNVVAFEELQCEISLGDSDIQSMTPLFSASNDQEQMIPDLSSKQMIKKLANHLRDLKLECQGNNSDLEIKVRRILDKLNTEHEFSMNELAYLLDYAGLQRRLSMKINKFQKE